MREKLHLDQIRCESTINKLVRELAPIKGLEEARIEMGTSCLVVDYPDAIRPQIDAAIHAAGLKIADRWEIPADQLV